MPFITYSFDILRPQFALYDKFMFFFYHGLGSHLCNDWPQSILIPFESDLNLFLIMFIWFAALEAGKWCSLLRNLHHHLH